jgi:hypothetical protein
MMTGHFPFAGEDEVQTAQQIINGTFRIPAYMSEDCASLIKGYGDFHLYLVLVTDGLVQPPSHRSPSPPLRR